MTVSRLTVAQALVRAMTAQWTEIDGRREPLFAGVWAIFGHGNVAALGEALYAARDALPTLRAHNEQAMAHAAVAFAKASHRRRMMACTTSIGPGATNLATAAAVAHVNRLPVLLLPGDVFATRAPDPVLQQLEDFSDGLVTANDCLRPVSRYFDRITRPEQLVNAFQRALQVLTDPATCGPATLALCQDVQAEACDWPGSFFEEHVWVPRRIRPSRDELARAVQALRAAGRPLIVCGGGVLYSESQAVLRDFCERHGVPSGETQAGKSALPGNYSLNLGGIGVTGTAAANSLAAQADLILAVGTRLQDFTTGSAALFRAHPQVVGLNVQPFDAMKHRAMPLVADAREGLTELSAALSDWRAAADWTTLARTLHAQWQTTARSFTGAHGAARPSDAQVIGAVQRSAHDSDIIVCAAGGLPGELHRHWQAGQSGGYHLEYGYSCMGYEIAGGLGVKLAQPAREVIVMVGDGSYLMLNSEIATSVQMGVRLTIVLLDNRGFACIERLQRSVGSASFNNLRAPSATGPDFVAHARSLGALATKVHDLAELESALGAARAAPRTSVIVIDTDAVVSTSAGGHWWDVPVPAVSERAEVRSAREAYLASLKARDG